ncbi:unnamed protein product [Alternaria alternata]|jgi:pimeloyl-ACP methyl ester carboxylesterase
MSIWWLIILGGPAASGVETLIRIGARLQNTIDFEMYPTPGSHNTPPGAQYFDVISFDPRGVNHTMPQLNCFPDPLHRLVWSLAADTEGLIGAASTSFDQRWSRFVSRSKTCTSVIQDQGDDSVAYYMGRRSVVDDIVAIAEHHGQWREEEARRLLLDPELPTMELTSAQIIARTRWRRGKEPILFWGTSYGTVLGSTLAAMYPGRIKRMILDSVLSPTYSMFDHTDKNLIHADELFARFVQLCHKYGPEKCQVYRESEEAISEVISSVLSDLVESPLAVGATMSRGPDVITQADLKRLIGKSLYQPKPMFPLLASVLHDLAQGNGSSLADYKATSKSLSVTDVLAGRYNVSTKCKADGPYSPACSRPNDWLEEGLLGISCGDGVAPGDATKEEFLAYWYGMRNQSSALGDVWSEWDMMCVGWGAKTKWAFDGQLHLSQAPEYSCSHDIGPYAGTPAHGILFVGNELDPVCPIEKYVTNPSESRREMLILVQSAYKLALSFSGSYVLEQKTIGVGQCHRISSTYTKIKQHSILSAESGCTDSTIRAYFQGKPILPKTECDVRYEAFEE